jgi:cold shock CspA family protein
MALGIIHRFFYRNPFMKNIIITVASAIFFAAVIVELSSRLWPGSYLALLLIATLGLFLNGLLATRLAGASAAPARKKQSPNRNRGGDRQRSRAKPEAGRETRSAGRSDSKPASPTTPPSPPTNDGPREDGEVKWFNRNKGFGFIIRESGEEIFVHQRSIRLIGDGDDRRRPTLRDGQAVNFQVAERDKGIQAEDVIAAD